MYCAARDSRPSGHDMKGHHGMAFWRLFCLDGHISQASREHRTRHISRLPPPLLQWPRCVRPDRCSIMQARLRRPAPIGQQPASCPRRHWLGVIVRRSLLDASICLMGCGRRAPDSTPQGQSTHHLCIASPMTLLRGGGQAVTITRVPRCPSQFQFLERPLPPPRCVVIDRWPPTRRRSCCDEAPSSGNTTR